MATELSRIEKEIILQSAIQSRSTLTLTQRTESLQVFLTEITADALVFAAGDGERTAGLTVGECVRLSLSFRNSVFSAEAPLLGRSGAVLRVSQPQTVVRKALRYSGQPRELHSVFELHAFDRQLPFVFPRETTGSTGEKDSALAGKKTSGRFDAALISELLRSFRQWAAAHSFESKVVLFGGETTMTFSERLVREAGRALVIPLTAVPPEVPQHIPPFEFLRTEGQRESTDGGPSGVLFPLSAGTSAAGYLYLTPTERTGTPEQIRSSAGKAGQPEEQWVRGVDLSTLCRFSRMFSHALRMNGFFGSTSAEAGGGEAHYIDAAVERGTLELTFAVGNAVYRHTGDRESGKLFCVSSGERQQYEFKFERICAAGNSVYFTGTIDGPGTGELAAVLHGALSRYLSRDVSSEKS